jgi:hypothetical protein
MQNVEEPPNNPLVAEFSANPLGETKDFILAGSGKIEDELGMKYLSHKKVVDPGAPDT